MELCCGNVVFSQILAGEGIGVVSDEFLWLSSLLLGLAV